MKVIHNTVTSWFVLTGRETNLNHFTKQFILFGYLQAISCIFPVIIFISLACSTFFDTGIPRYDMLFLICILAQVIMYASGTETRDELYVITFFHLLGLIMEVHKVHRGSWSYPEDAYTKVFGVPLYSGFMYASVGSYICQAWRNLSLSVVHWPKPLLGVTAAIAIYLNFFANAFIPDLRWYIVVFLVIIFRRTNFVFRINDRTYQIHALLSFLIIGFFIWLAENIATFYGAWKYAYQHSGWKMVKWHKISSWALLVIVSIIIVGELKRIKTKLSS